MDKAFHHYRTTHISRGNLFTRAKLIYEREGIFCFIHSCCNYLFDLCFSSTPNRLRLWYYKAFHSKETFEFEGTKYHYLFHSYCPTWKNERAAVIPIIWDIVKRYEAEGKRVLEIGNMLSFVYPINHDVLDKYEIVNGVINEDVVSFRPAKEYDLICSILTLQEVGLKEVPSDPVKSLIAFENLKSILSNGGQMVIVHGMGVNLDMDNAIRNGTIKFSEQYCLNKIGGYVWKEATWDDIRNAQYDYSVPTATGVLIGIIKNVDSA